MQDACLMSKDQCLAVTGSLRGRSVQAKFTFLSLGSVWEESFVFVENHVVGFYWFSPAHMAYIRVSVCDVGR